MPVIIHVDQSTLAYSDFKPIPNLNSRVMVLLRSDLKTSSPCGPSEDFSGALSHFCLAGHHTKCLKFY